MLQQKLYHSTELNSVLSFISDVWPLLLMSLLFSAFLFLCWYFGFLLQKQKIWLKNNKQLIEQYKVLQLSLIAFGQQISCCKNCNERDMQLWDYQQKLLVVRCRSCKMTYTFTKEHNQLVLKILFQIECVMILLNTLVVYRYHAFGRLLARALEVDITAVNATTTPLEIIHFTAQNEYMVTLNSVKNIEIFEWEVVAPNSLELIAV
jgi:hypothetical protein